MSTDVAGPIPAEKSKQLTRPHDMIHVDIFVYTPSAVPTTDSDDSDVVVSTVFSGFHRRVRVT